MRGSAHRLGCPRAEESAGPGVRTLDRAEALRPSFPSGPYPVDGPPAAE